jgi:glycosyltransferase involved in cell wall biosynthesis
VSEGYAQELIQGQDPSGPANPELQALLASKGLSAVLNGVDTSFWDPARDPLLPSCVRYDASSAGVGKAAAKRLLQQRLGLDVDPCAPLFVFVGRLSQQKGVDVMLAALPQLMRQRAAAAGKSHWTQKLQQQGATVTGGSGPAASTAAAAAGGGAGSSSGKGDAEGGTQERPGAAAVQEAAASATGAASSPAAGSHSSSSQGAGAAQEASGSSGPAQSAATASAAEAASSSSQGAGAVPEAAGRLQVALLGNGERWMEEVLGQLDGRYPGRAVGVPAFNEPLAHLMLAAADFLLVPSRFEPCGLVALAGLRYGAIPLGTATGGLGDVVTPSVGYRLLNPGPEGDTASFRKAVASLVGAVQEAAGEYGSERFEARRAAAMAVDVSWQQPCSAWETLLLQLSKQAGGSGNDSTGSAAAAAAGGSGAAAGAGGSGAAAAGLPVQPLQMGGSESAAQEPVPCSPSPRQQQQEEETTGAVPGESAVTLPVGWVR